MVTVSEETAVDYELTAKIATEAFALGDVHFSAERIKWLYERSFGRGTTVLAATDDGRKIGQIALIGQSVCVAGEVHPAVQLIDLFILKAYRSAQLVRKLYKEVETFCASRNIRYILALPNDKSVLLNARFLKLSPLLWLQIRAGVSLRQPTPGKISHSGQLKAMTRDQAIELFSGFNCPASENGSHWDAESLFDRLDDPTRAYAVHTTDNLLLVSAERETRGVSYTALCAFFARPSTDLADGEVDDLVRAACRLWKRPAFVYVGTNSRLPKLPGVPLPGRLRRPILVQLRDTSTDGHDVRFDRFQLIDSDFA
ncbi:MAG TPA: GNAT family N-acetyltransferase [Bradyrhizobium sp.]|uniref:GNAT family N-acetyltransferase n=1 Tax=Bradyrhizobium sp. TaxID=376 RepID=UPI002CE0BD0E|nr:GNAT family N-acetyltransferase [Bradyrhizobium sp.]HLZ06827.1 GNAT family N-acetyltransferase [Bradyrhizobium sp.]